MITKDFYFSVNLDPTISESKTLYTPQILFGDHLIWEGNLRYEDRQQATTEAEARLVTMMAPIFNIEGTEDSMYKSHKVKVG